MTKFINSNADLADLYLIESGFKNILVPVF